jgi:hypothetical protein
VPLPRIARLQLLTLDPFSRKKDRRAPNRAFCKQSQLSKSQQYFEREEQQRQHCEISEK